MKVNNLSFETKMHGVWIRYIYIYVAHQNQRANRKLSTTKASTSSVHKMNEHIQSSIQSYMYISSENVKIKPLTVNNFHLQKMI